MPSPVRKDILGSEPLYRVVIKGIMDDIGRNVLKPNDRLPSETQLMKRFGVSRVTVRRGLSELVERGLIYKSQGKGSFVCKRDLANSLARSGRLVGVVVPYVNAPHMSGLLSNLEEHLHSVGYRVVLCNFEDDPAAEAQHLADLALQGVSGFIWYPSNSVASANAARRLLMSGTPFVLVDRHFTDLDCDYVGSNNFDGSYQLVSHLIDRGCRRIAYATDSPVYPTPRRERFQGYQKALEDHGLTFCEKLIIVPDSDDAYVGLKATLPRLEGIDGVFASNVRVVLALLKAMRELGWRTPDDLRITCFDGYGPAVPVDINLTSANQVTAEITRLAVNCLVRRIQGESDPPIHHVVRPRFHIGNTT